MIDIRDVTKLIFQTHDIEFDSPEFSAFWNKNYSLIAIRDEHCSIDDLLGDLYNPEVNPDIDAAQLKREKMQEIARIKKYGVWGVGIALDNKPIYETFIWGFVGDDFLNSSYDGELLELLITHPVEGN